MELQKKKKRNYDNWRKVTTIRLKPEIIKFFKDNNLNISQTIEKHIECLIEKEMNKLKKALG